MVIITNIEIGKEFGISYTVVSKIAKDVERLVREDKGFCADVERMISRFKKET